MKRITDQGTGDEGWTLDIGAGGVVTARHPAGGVLIAKVELVARADGGGGLWKIVDSQHFVEDGYAEECPPPSIGWVQAQLAQPEYFAVVMQFLNAPSDSPGPLPMRLFPVGMPEELKGKPKPDNFYVKLAGYVRLCREHHIAYGPRIAADNGVNENTVRGWVLEARRRGLLADEVA